MKLINNNVLDALKELPNESVDCIITSPPYYSLRSYLGADTIWGGNPECEHVFNTLSHSTSGQSNKATTQSRIEGLEKEWQEGFCSKCGAWKGQLGLEPTYDMYIQHLMIVTKELKRVLKKTGTMFWNMADSYSSKGGLSNPENLIKAKVGNTKSGEQKGIRYIKGIDVSIQNKSLMMIPERFALAMIDDGWILRNKLCWHKCLGSNTQIVAKTNGKIFRSTLKDLYKIKKSDIYLPTADGNWAKVIRIEKQAPNELLTIHLRNGMKIECTPEHRFLLENGELKQAKELKVSDKLKHANYNDMPSTEIGSYDTGFIIGLYLAEGSKTEKMVQFSLNAKELNLGDKIKQFAIKYNGIHEQYTYNNSLAVHLSGIIPIAIIDHYVTGYGAKKKHLSSNSYNESNVFLSGVLDGYLVGDGHYEKENNRWRIGFALNRELEYDLRYICNRLGYNMRARLGHAKENKSGKIFPIIRGEIRKERTGHFNQKDDYEILRIEQTSGITYDIEIDSPDHLFMLLDGTITHNSNGMPSSVKDRFSNKWEYVFFFTKSKKYYFDLDAVRKPLSDPDRLLRAVSGKRYNSLDAKDAFMGNPHYGINKPRPNIKQKYSGIYSSLTAEESEMYGSPRARNLRKQKYEENSSYEGKHSGYFNEDGTIRANLKGANPGDVMDTVDFFRKKGQGGNYDYGGLNSDEAKHNHPLGSNPGDVIESKYLEDMEQQVASPAGRVMRNIANGKTTTLVREAITNVNQYLKDKLKESNISLGKLAEITGEPETQIAHYFRTDSSGCALPNRNFWDKVKDILGLDEYDMHVKEEYKSVMLQFNPLGSNPGDVVETPAVRSKSWAAEKKYNNGKPFYHGRWYDPDADGGDFMSIATIPHKDSHFAMFPETLVAPLIKAGCPKGGVVLDPFAGSGTTGVVAQVLGRDSILIEISPEYCKIIEDRFRPENVEKVVKILKKHGHKVEEIVQTSLDEAVEE